jgi:translation elongation factor EF-1alpha
MSASKKPHMNLVVVGHVDNGKSTIVGHLLVDMGVIDQRTIDAFAMERAIPSSMLGSLTALKMKEKEASRLILLSKSLKRQNIFTR